MQVHRMLEGECTRLFGGRSERLLHTQGGNVRAQNTIGSKRLAAEFDACAQDARQAQIRMVSIRLGGLVQIGNRRALIGEQMS